MLIRTQVHRHLRPYLRQRSCIVLPHYILKGPCPVHVHLGLCSSDRKFNHVDQTVGFRVPKHGISSSSFHFWASKQVPRPSSEHQKISLVDGFTFSRSWPYLYRDTAHGVLRQGNDLSSSLEKKKGFDLHSRQRVYYSAGAGAATLLMFIAASAAISMSAAEMHGIALSGFLALYDSAVEFARKLAGIMWSFEGAMVESIVDFVEAGAAAWVLVRCLASVLASASDSATLDAFALWRPRVASLLADLAAHENRRKAVVESGNGAVVDWLLKAVGGGRPACMVTQAEASRALAHLLSDVNTCESVLGRPHALPYLLHFAASLQPRDAIESLKPGKKEHVTQEGGEVPRGKSLLVAAIMDLITSSCDSGDAFAGFRPMLPGKADPADVVTALQVVGGGWLTEDEGNSKGKDGKDRGAVSVPGTLVHPGTDVVGIQRMEEFFSQVAIAEWCKKSALFIMDFWALKSPLGRNLGGRETSGPVGTVKSLRVEGTEDARGIIKKRSSGSSGSSYGLWDDLPGLYVAVPLAAWALATWAQASSANRSTIAHIDKDGDALLAAVLAPERTVRWHGAKAIMFLLQNVDQGFSDVAARWSSALLAMAAQAGSTKDSPLTNSALTALRACVSHSQGAHDLVTEKGLPVLRKLAKQTEMDARVQGALAQTVDLFTATGGDLSLDESKKWSPILLRWVCSQKSEYVTRDCGCHILMRVVNSLGQGGIPISQAWLAMLLMDIVSDNIKIKPIKLKGASTDVKEAKERGMVQSERIQVATAAASQLAKVVAQEAAAAAAATEPTEQAVAESAAELPMVDLLGFDFPGDSSSKSGNKEPLPKVTAGEAALATLKAVKALTELTAEEPVGRQRIIDAGGLYLLRRLLLCDDFGEWAAAEASEDAKKNSGVQPGNEGLEKQVLPGRPKDLSDSKGPPIAHIQKHAARLLSILSLQPLASLEIADDPVWCDWLEACAEGQFSNDLKMRSYACVILLHVARAKEMAASGVGLQGPGRESEYGSLEGVEIWPRYEDTVFLMNPEAPYWKVQFGRRSIGTANNKGVFVVGKAEDLSVGFPRSTQSAGMVRSYLRW